MSGRAANQNQASIRHQQRTGSNSVERAFSDYDVWRHFPESVGGGHEAQIEQGQRQTGLHHYNCFTTKPFGSSQQRKMGCMPGTYKKIRGAMLTENVQRSGQQAADSIQPARHVNVVANNRHDATKRLSEPQHLIAMPCSPVQKAPDADCSGIRTSCAVVFFRGMQLGGLSTGML